jgi:hypothetical protein
METLNLPVVVKPKRKYIKKDKTIIIKERIKIKPIIVSFN